MLSLPNNYSLDVKDDFSAQADFQCSAHEDVAGTASVHQILRVRRCNEESNPKHNTTHQ